jgi:hypothetical protein
MIYKNACEYFEMTDEEIAEVKKIAAGLSRLGKKAEKMGLKIFGGSGSGTLRKDDGTNSPVILADLSGASVWDGGDGAEMEDENGILRGE